MFLPSPGTHRLPSIRFAPSTVTCPKQTTRGIFPAAPGMRPFFLQPPCRSAGLYHSLPVHQGAFAAYPPFGPVFHVPLDSPSHLPPPTAFLRCVEPPDGD